MSAHFDSRRFRRTLVKFGVFIAISGLAGTIVFGTLLGEQVGTTDTFHAVFADVSGLQSGDPVRVSGVVVGEVDDITLEDATHVDVTFTANRDQQLTTTTNAVIRYANLLGQRFLALTQNGRPGRPLAAGDTIPQSRTAPALSLTVLFNGFRPLFQSLDVKQVNQLTGEIVQVLQGETGTIDHLVAQTAQLTTNLADRADVFTGVIDNLTKLLRTVVKHDDQFAGALGNLRALTATLAKDSPNISASLGAIDGLASSVSHLLGGIQARGIDGVVSDLGKVGDTLVSNADLLDTTVRAFPRAFEVLDRVSQTGSWINAYPCAANVRTIGSPQVSGQDIDDALSIYLTGTTGNTLLGTLLKLLGLASAAVTVPVTVPQGPVGDQNAHSAACR
jgi:phospholipid/cholesterol/gamma-HCH transport system substrate-binding protein